MPSLAVFFGVIISIALLIICIVFFIKLWKMTDDVNAIKRKYCDKIRLEEVSPYYIVVKYKRLGKKDEALDYLRERMDTRLDNLVKDIYQYKNAKELQEGWDREVALYKKVYEYLGEPMPEVYKNFNFFELERDIETIR